MVTIVVMVMVMMMMMMMMMMMHFIVIYLFEVFVWMCIFLCSLQIKRRTFLAFIAFTCLAFTWVLIRS